MTKDKDWRIDARGTRRRLQALACTGWTIPMIAKELGYKTSRPLYKIRSGDQLKINRSTGRKVAIFYEANCMYWKLGQYPQIARELAKAQGWIPPLGWDDIDRDDNPAI